MVSKPPKKVRNPMNKRRKVASLKLIFSLLWTVFLVFTPAGIVLAHANLVHSVPDRGAVLATAPQSVILEFTENLDPQLSQVQLIDSHGTVIVAGPGSIDASAPRVMKLSLPTLSDGTYSAVWQAHSMSDGHFTSGSVGFSVGAFDPNLSMLPAEDAPIPTETFPPLAEIALRWAGYLAAALLGGGIFFAALVWRPAYRSSPQPPAGFGRSRNDGGITPPPNLLLSGSQSSDQRPARLIRRQVLAGAGLLIGFTLLSILYQAWTAAANSPQPDFGAALANILNINSGWPYWGRIAFMVLIIGLITLVTNPGRDPLSLWLALLGCVVLVMATFSLKSHAAALKTPLAVAADMAHITAMSAWLGGLPPLFLCLRLNLLSPAVLVPHFTRLALACVGILALTGLYGALEQVASLEGLTASLYGQALLVKTGLFGLLIGLGALNFLVLTPRFRRDENVTSQHMRLSIRTEWLLGALLLIAVGIMAGASPAFDALQAKRQMGIVGDYRQDGIQLRLWLAPGITGVNETAVDVSGAAGADTARAQVLLRFRRSEGKLGTTQAEAKTSDQMRYTVRGSYFTLAGDWTIQAIFRRPGQNDISHTFAVTIHTDPNDPNPTNPIPADTESIADGGTLYQEHCLLCHGISGRGDGPGGLALSPRPADLTYHTIPGVHTDGELYFWISHGLPRTAMPAFESLMSEKQRWDLVNFIRTLAQPVK